MLAAKHVDSVILSLKEFVASFTKLVQRFDINGPAMQVVGELHGITVFDQFNQFVDVFMMVHFLSPVGAPSVGLVGG
jgi:hypothetical protein